jgi:hypothetical protein
LVAFKNGQKLKIPVLIANNNSPKLRSEKLRKQKENSGPLPK